MSSPSGARNRRPWQRHNRGDSMRATIFAIIVLAFGFQTDANAQQQPTLKDAYKGCFLVGAALNPAQFSGAAPLEHALIKDQFTTIRPARARLKPNSITTTTRSKTRPNARVPLNSSRG